MTAKYDANLIVIGAGSGGLVTAYIAAAIKAKVILIEKGDMGGDCLNTGCVPSKSFIASAKFIHDLKHSKNFGITHAQCDFDFGEVMTRVHAIIASIAPHDSVDRYRALGVDVICGSAEIISRHKVRVNDKEYSARAIVIAAGAEPFVPPIPGLEQVDYLTSDTVWKLRELPRKLVVLGGGPIGCELTQCFARFGSEVTIVQRDSQLINREDNEFSKEIEATFKAEGVQVLTHHLARRVMVEGGKKYLECERDGQTVRVEFDQILVALGRAARLENYGLENINVPISPRRTIATNEYLQAGDTNIYAVGDVTGPYQFTHAAAHQAWYVCVNALFSPLKKFKVDYSVLPWCTYTDPEVARVGLNESDAKQRGVKYEVTSYDIGELDRAKTDGHAKGTVKILTVPGKDRILGVTIISRHAGELIAEFVLAMQHGLGLNKILGTIHAYPTWTEANKYAAGNWKKQHAPRWALYLLKKFHNLRR